MLSLKHLKNNYCNKSVPENLNRNELYKLVFH